MPERQVSLPFSATHLLHCWRLRPTAAAPSCLLSSCPHYWPLLVTTQLPSGSMRPRAWDTLSLLPHANLSQLLAVLALVQPQAVLALHRQLLRLLPLTRQRRRRMSAPLTQLTSRPTCALALPRLLPLSSLPSQPCLAMAMRMCASGRLMRASAGLATRLAPSSHMPPR